MGTKWKSSWDHYDTKGIFRSGYNFDKLVISEEDFEIVKNAYNEYISLSKSILNREKREMLTEMANRGSFSCLSSGSPFPYYLDNQCHNFGFKTKGMISLVPPSIGVLASGNISSVNSTIDGVDVNVSGMEYKPPVGSNEIFVGLPGGGMVLPKTNSEQFAKLSVGLIIASVIVVFISIIGAGVITGGFGKKTIFGALDKNVPPDNTTNITTQNVDIVADA